MPLTWYHTASTNPSLQNKISLLLVGDIVLFMTAIPSWKLSNSVKASYQHSLKLWMVTWEIFLKNVNKIWAFTRSGCVILHLQENKLYKHHKNHKCTLNVHEKKVMAFKSSRARPHLWVKAAPWNPQKRTVPNSSLKQLKMH